MQRQLLLRGSQYSTYTPSRPQPVTIFDRESRWWTTSLGRGQASSMAARLWSWVMDACRGVEAQPSVAALASAMPETASATASPCEEGI
jgi:hypothetical protein